MAKKIVWSQRANDELTELLLYWEDRNCSKVFSAKLYAEIQEELKLLAVFPRTRPALQRSESAY